MRGVCWILCCLSLLVLSECSQIVLSNEVENANTWKCQIGSFRDVHISAGHDTFWMVAEGKAYNWKVGYPDKDVVLDKDLKIDVITTCYDSYCQALWKETSESGGYYLYMARNGYIYETSSTSSKDRYFEYAYDSGLGRCVWRNQLRNRYLTKSKLSGSYFMVGGSSGPVLDVGFW